LSAPATQPLLQVDGLHISFGGIHALDDVSFSILDGETVGIIGPNGSGKTTLFNCLSGVYTADQGNIRLGGTAIAGLPSHEIARKGISRTFQNLALFPTMTVLENVMVGCHSRSSSGFVANALGLASMKREEKKIRERAWYWVERLGLQNVAHDLVTDLPMGTQKKTELSRALAAEPTLLMLDEPAGGISHEEIDELEQLIRRIRDEFSVTIMLVEHAERFGLAQLHQFRGRVGRGARKSYCILQGDPSTTESWQRLRVMEETTDGFRIAEEDLRIRGMGNLLGREQSGLPPFRVGDLLKDGDALRAAREEAFRLLEDDPKLEAPGRQGLRQRARELYKDAGVFAGVG